VMALLRRLGYSVMLLSSHAGDSAAESYRRLEMATGQVWVGSTENPTREKI
jgi:hypothetical protein